MLATLPLQRPVGDQGRHEEGVAGTQQRQAFGVEQVAMLDAAHPGPQRPVDRPRGVGVRADVPVGRRRLLDRRSDLRDRILRRVDAVGGGGDAAGGHDLEVVRAPPQLLPGGPPDGVHPVGHRADPRPEAASGRRPSVAGRPHVAVTAGLAQRVPAEEQPRPGQQALGLGAGQAVIGAAHVAHGGEPAAQHRPHGPGGVRGDVGARSVLQVPQLGREGGDVHVPVDQTRHEVPAGDVQLVGVRRGQIGADRRDRCVVHPDVGGAPRPVGQIEDVAAAQDRRGGHGFIIDPGIEDARPGLRRMRRKVSGSGLRSEACG